MEKEVVMMSYLQFNLDLYDITIRGWCFLTYLSLQLSWVWAENSVLLKNDMAAGAANNPSQPNRRIFFKKIFNYF